MSSSSTLSVSFVVTERQQLIDLSNAFAEALAGSPDLLFTERKPIKIALNGSSNAGKSIIPDFVAARLFSFNADSRDLHDRRIYPKKCAGVDRFYEGEVCGAGGKQARAMFTNPVLLHDMKYRRRAILRSFFKGIGGVAFVSHASFLFNRKADAIIRFDTADEPSWSLWWNKKTDPVVRAFWEQNKAWEEANPNGYVRNNFVRHITIEIKSDRLKEEKSIQDFISRLQGQIPSNPVAPKFQQLAA